MVEDLKHLIDLLVAVMLAVGGWFMKGMHDRLLRLETSTQSIAAAQKDRDEWHEEMRELRSQMNKQHERFDAKLDRIIERLPAKGESHG